jgi:hypothetical protein
VNKVGVEITNQVDIIGINKESGICTLTIVDSLEWSDENDHLLLLQEKINTYLSFIESSEVYSSYSPAKDKDFEINIRFQNSIPGSCERFLQQASQIVSDAGFALTYSIG